MDSDYHLKKMQYMSNSRGHQMTYKHRPIATVPYGDLVVKFYELQQQVSRLNKLVYREQAQSQVQRNIITGLQRELKSATRQTETQRALKEKSIHREKEIRKELVRMIKNNSQEALSPEINIRQRKKKKKKPNAEHGKVESGTERCNLQKRRYKCFSEQQKKAKMPHVKFNKRYETVREQVNALKANAGVLDAVCLSRLCCTHRSVLDTPVKQLSFKEKTQRHKQSIDELSVKFNQNCSLKVKISIEPKAEREDELDPQT